MREKYDDKNKDLNGFVAMIRHGERADNVDWKSLGINYEIQDDPPLTPLGL